METGSAILFAQKGAEQSIYSVNHGAGRRLSRGEARRQLDQAETDERMKEADILINTRVLRSPSERTTAIFTMGR